jgi:N-acetylneuraminate lyase
MDRMVIQKAFSQIHVLPALITPFDANNHVAEQTLRDLVRWHLREGATGFYVGGSSGEFLLLSLDERKRVVEIVREETDKDHLLICHVGAPRTEDAIALARHAEAAGVDMISSIPPIYYHYSFLEMESYFLQIAHSVSLPFLVYNIPALSNINLNTDQIGSLLRKDGIIGVKYTSYDLFSLQNIRAMNPDKLLLIGHDELFLPALTCRVNGGIGSAFNILLPKFVKIKECFASGEMDKAYGIQSEASLIIKDLLKFGIFPSLKFILSEMGFDCGPCRKPFCELGGDAKAFLKQEVIPRI